MMAEGALAGNSCNIPYRRRQKQDDEDSVSFLQQSGNGDETRTPREEEEGAVNDDDSDSDDSESVLSFSRVITNNLFFVGSVLYTVLALWDLRNYAVEAEETLEPSPSPTLSLSPSPFPSQEDDDWTDEYTEWDAYRILGAIAATIYVVQAVVEFHCAIANVGESNDGDHLLAIADPVTFGLAATCGLFSVFLMDEDNPEPAYVANTAGAYTYLLNAVVALSGRGSLSCSSLPLALDGAGDVLFLIGSIIDTLLSNFNSPDTSDATWHHLGWWSFVSALLWLIDSVLYIVSDYVIYIETRRAEDLVSMRVPLIDVREQEGNVL